MMKLTNYRNLSVVMISKNEEKAIYSVVTEIKEKLPEVEIIVVDGSSDKTPDIAKSAGARVFREPKIGGYGPALHSAIFLSNRDFVATVDADKTYCAEDIARLLTLMVDTIDIVGGSRIMDGKPKTMPMLNYLANLGVSLLASLCFGRKISDIHSGLRIYRMTKLRKLSWKRPDYGFTVELILIPIAQNFKVIEVPITYRERIGDSQLMKFKSFRATLISILRARFVSRGYTQHVPPRS